MTERAIEALTGAAIRAAARGAAEYLKAHGLTADNEALAECLRANIKIRIPDALREAKEAMGCNMGRVAELTFGASMMQAGIEAAKECGKTLSRAG